MSKATQTIEFRIKMSFPVFLGIVALLHFILFVLGPIELPQFTQPKAVQNSEEQSPRTLNIRRIGHQQGSKQNNTYLSSTPTKTKEISPTVSQKGIQSNALSGETQVKRGQVSKNKVDLSDLAATPSPVQQNKISEKTIQPEKSVRPGTMPIVARKKAIEAINLTGQGIKEFAQSNGQAGQNERNYNVSGSQSISSFQNTNVGVNLEVPEGVSPDELNEYELMFYSFQRRVALAYVNSFMSTYNRFDRINPQLRFPMTDTQETMTGRLTYDAQGNIKQIKMVRWTNVDKLQDFFLDVLKGMDTIQNPPKSLWEKNGEFTVFFTLVVNPQR